MKRLVTRIFVVLAATCCLCLAGGAGAAILVSSALDAEDTDITGTSGTFSGTPGGDIAPALAAVTTTVVTNNGGLTGKFDSGTTGTKSQTFRAVSAANGMDLTYTVNYSPFRYESGTGDVPTSTRRSGYVAVSSANSNTEREQTTANVDGTEFWVVTIDDVVNSGTTPYDLDGAITLNFSNLAGIAVYDTYVNNVTGTLLGSGGAGTVISGDSLIALSGPATSFAIVATVDDTASNFENRWEGLAVQFSPPIPEPSSLALLGLSLVVIARRRRGCPEF